MRYVVANKYKFVLGRVVFSCIVDTDACILLTLSVRFVCFVQPFKYAKPLGLLHRLLHQLGPPTGDNFSLNAAGEVSQEILDNIESQPWLIDAGCGSASFGCAAKIAGNYNVLAYDNDAEMVKLATKRLNMPLADLVEEGAPR